MALSIKHWATYTQGKTKMVRKSENAVESNHVLKFLFDDGKSATRPTSDRDQAEPEDEGAVSVSDSVHATSPFIEANVQASMKNCCYKVKVI